MASKKRKVDGEAQEEQKPADLASDTLQQSVDAHHGGGGGQEEASAVEEEEDVGQILDPLTRDQLLSLLRSAAVAHPPTLAEIRRLADLDPSHRKLFVHGLGWDTTSDGLRAAFASFGDIEDCRVVSDRGSGRSKGYGFVLFRRRAASRAALREPQRLIDGRMTACQLASAGPPAHQNPNPSSNPNSHNPNPPQQESNLARKIYVGNVHADVDGGRLRSFFAKFGEIEEGPIGFDRQTGKPKGFALFVYRTVDGARKALEEPNKNFEGHLLYCQKATDGKTKGIGGAGAAAVAFPNAPLQEQGYNGSVGYGGLTPEMGLPGMMGQGLLGMGGAQPFGQGMLPNATLLAMLAAAGQNPGAFGGMTPAMLASLNPALASAFGTGAPAVVPPTGIPSNVQAQGFMMGNAGFHGPPGFQGTPQVGQHGGGGGGSYPSAPMGQGPMPRPPVGPMGGGYGPH